MQGTSSVVDSIKNIVCEIMHYRYLVEPFLCARGGEFVVIVEVYGACIKGIETSVEQEFVGSSGCSIVGKFCER